MFRCYYKDDEYKPITVYAVDADRDAFLVNRFGKFKWVPMEDFIPFNE